MEIFRHTIYFQAILLCAAIFLNPISCSHSDSKLQKPTKEEKKLLFVFGDSLFDPGNNQYLSSDGSGPGTNWPYGMNNHNHSTGRLSDGLLVPDFIAKFAGLNILPPVLQPNADFSDGVNFASAGGGVLENDSNFLAMRFRAQLEIFKKVVSSMVKKVGEANAKNILMRSVFMISMGGNDYFSFNTNHPNATETERTHYRNMVVGNLTTGIKELYDMGLRKLAVQNVGPLGCYPMIRSRYPELEDHCVKRFLEDAYQHNKALSGVLRKLEKTLPGFKYSMLDYFYALGDRIKNPTKYGFKVGDIACCGSGLYNGRDCGKSPFNLCENPNEYVLFDGGHHTQRTNIQLAKLLWSGVPNITAPRNMKQLFELA